MTPQIDINILVSALEARRIQMGISWREIGRQAGVASSTLSRLQQCKLPDLTTFAALVRWLEMSSDDLLGIHASSSGPPPVGALLGLLRGRPMTPKQAAALDEMVQAAHRFFILVNIKRAGRKRSR